MVNKRRKSRLPRSIQEALIRQFVAETPFLSGEIKLDESYFGGQPSQRQTRTRGRRENDRLRPAQAKRQGSCPIVPGMKTSTLEPIIRETVRPESIVYTVGLINN